LVELGPRNKPLRALESLNKCSTVEHGTRTITEICWSSIRAFDEPSTQEEKEEEAKAHHGQKRVNSEERSATQSRRTAEKPFLWAISPSTSYGPKWWVSFESHAALQRIEPQIIYNCVNWGGHSWINLLTFVTTSRAGILLYSSCPRSTAVRC